MSGTGFKDHFSTHPGDYEKFRPVYPDQLFEYLSRLAPDHRLAWDCATGSGQAAVGLARHFQQVIATDASQSQIAHAVPHRKIEYQVLPAEHTTIPARSVDLVSVVQALHWFDLDAFYSEAKRVLRPAGVIAVWSYSLLRIAPDVDAAIAELYENVLGDYWPAERALVESRYEAIDFPFKEVAVPEFRMLARWSLAELLGYLGTWSAVQKYKEVNRVDPVLLIWDELARAWPIPSDATTVEWPLALRVGINAEQTQAT